MNYQETNDLFEDLQDLIRKYSEYRYRFHKEEYAPSINPKAESFNMLLVITNRRDAMLFQASEDYSEGKNSKEINDVLRQLYLDLRTLIVDTYGISNLDFLFEKNNIWVYNKRIQEEVDKKQGTKYLYDILGYICPFPKRGVFTFKANFYYNSTVFIGMSCANVSLKEIAFLRAQLAEFKTLADFVGGKVSLEMTFT